MSRALDLTTSLTPETVTTNRAAMEWFIAQANGRPMTAVPPLRSPDWIGEYRQALAAQTDVFEVAAQDADGAACAYRVRPGVRLVSEHVAPGSVAATLRQVELFREVRSAHRGLADTPMLVSVPHPIDLALVTFVGPTRPHQRPRLRQLRHVLEHLHIYIAAVTRFMGEVGFAAGPDVLFDLQMPSALLTMEMARTVSGGRGRAAHWHAGVTAKLLSQLPKASDVVLRLRPDVDVPPGETGPTDLSGTVFYLNQLANAMRRQWARQLHWQTRPPARLQSLRPRRLPAVHVPATFDDQGPCTKPEFYAALRELDPEWERLIAGVVVDNLPAAHRALVLLETAADRTTTALARVSPRAGCSDEQAKASATIQRHLAYAEPTIEKGGAGAHT